ncbi:ATP-binding cassette sub-family A member 2-like isoform X3 [Symsagittifera roscoffensis]|uniref:ATP-binding cassette sub-family A member 2-like isoform X3 n=1 Tax=Symsagittifera roscoffensis TaxID=84072 RepID=UPI00307B80B5
MGNLSSGSHSIYMFFRQLRLLLWKNAVLKKRTPVVTLLETIIPLVIFIILVLMRMRLPPVEQPIQMPKHQPLVSAGLVPLIQSVCINEKVCKPYGVPKGTYFHKLLNDLHSLHSELAASNTEETEDNLRSLLFISRKELAAAGIDRTAMLQELTNANIVMNETKKFSTVFLTNETFRLEARRLIDKYKTSRMLGRRFKEASEDNTGLFSEDKLVMLMSLSDKTPELMQWLGFLPEDTCDSLVDENYDRRKLTQAALEMWHQIQPDLCANYEKLTMQDVDLKRFEKLNLETHQFLMLQHWQSFLDKNLKILFTPVTEDTEKIVAEMSSTATTLRKLPVFLNNFLQVSEAFRSYLKLKNPNAFEQGVSVLDVVTFLNVEFNGTEPNIEDLRKTYPGLTVNFLKMLDVFDRAACAMKLMLRDRDLDVFEGVATESEAVHLLANGDAAREGNRILAVIVFDVDEQGRIGSHVSYKIRQSQSETADTRFVRSSYWYPGTDTHGLNENNYYTYGFLWVQDLVDRAIINFQTGRSVEAPGLYIQKFPAPCYDNDVFAEVIEHGMPLFMLLSWIYFSSVLVNAVAKEKETRLKESMRMMGLTRTVHWAAWFFTAFLHMQVTLLLLVLLIHFGNLLPQSNPLVLHMFFSIFCVAMICFCFFISCIFNNSQVASAFTGILLVFLHVPFTFIHIVETYNKQIISAAIKSIVCLIPVTPMAMGVKYFTIYEIQKEGIQWHNLNSSPSDGDNFSALKAMLMLIVDSVVYAFLAWYIEAIRPGPYGIPLPWYFPFMKSYWSSKQDHAEVSMQCILCGGGGTDSETDDKHSLASSQALNGGGSCYLGCDPYSNPVDRNLFETEPDDLVLGVAIKSLSKKYKSAGKYALRGLTLNMYEGQITALLGHNGAGKSTTMSILCGVQPPSHGTAKIYNKDIRFQMDAIRQEMGMCPQHNVLFDNLTVEEHLYLFANLKLPSASKEQINVEVERLLHDMDLPTDRHTLVRKLSSGVQRKLSVAMTFIGDPKLIILDEPTSNVDPQARRAIWDLLIKYKDNHTILMSTHFMDEAQMLGDRIAMISGGVLRCVGTPIYLLNRLGAGYHLTLHRQMHGSAGSSSYSDSVRQFNKREVTEFVRRFIGAATLQKVTQTDVEYILPREFVETSNFENLLKELTQNLSQFGLTSFGLRDTSLEEVFFKICESAGNLRNTNRLSQNPDQDPNESFSNQTEDNEHHPEHNMGHANGRVEENQGDNSVLHDESYMSDGSYNEPQPHAANLPDVVISQPSIACSTDMPFSNLKRVSGPSLYLNQFVALSKKKLILTAKNPKLLLTQIAFPLLFMLAAMSMAYMSSYTGDSKMLRMSTAQYEQYHVPFGMKNEIPVAAVVSSLQSTEEQKQSDAGPLDLVETLRLASGVGADCTLLPGMNEQIFNDFTVPNFLYPDWCLVQGTPVEQVLGSRDANASFSSAIKTFPQKRTTVAHYCEDTGHRCEECSNAVLKCHNMTSSVGYEQFVFDTWANDRVVDVSEESSRFGFDVDDQFQLHAFDHRQRNRYGGLVFKDYVYEPGMVADLPDIYNSLFSKQQAKVYYNSKGYHSIPIYVNAANNAILRANLVKFNKSADPREFGITTYSQPIRAGHLPSKNLMDHGNDVVVAMLVLTGFSSLPASFLMHLVYERTHKMKHLQLVSGMHPVVYWLSNFVWDLIVSCIPIFLSYVIMVSIGVRAYTEGQNSLALLYLLLTYVWAVIPSMYLFSFVFNEPATAYVGLGVSNLLTGVIMVIIVYMFDTVVRNDEVISQINSILKACFVVVPIYNVGHGFTYIAFNQILNDFYLSFGLDEKVVEPFDWSATTRGIVINFVQGFVAFALVILCEYNLFLQISVKTEEPLEEPLKSASDSEVNKGSIRFACDSPGAVQIVDPDVKAERERVKRSRDPVRLMNLTKVYTSLDMGRFRAVNNVSVGIRQGEIFGLCGSNGSGKTELFKLLTLDSHPSDGTIFIDNHNAAKNKNAIWSIIGYCPQHEALFGEMTGQQHLELYAALRGYSRKSMPKVIKETIAEMDLIECRDKETDTYSGGMKRKLSAALALIGDPKIVVLDDPTAGMDPRSRRFLWTLIKKLNEKGRTVIFASNSMDECERLCSRLAIMIRGSFISLGSVNHLKNRSGDMYNIKCRLERGADFSLIAQFMTNELPKAEVVEEHFNVITYEVAAEHLNLPRVFSLLGTHKAKLGIVDYSVSQKTLEMGYMNILRRELLLEQQNKDANLINNIQSSSKHQDTAESRNKPFANLSSRANFVRALKKDQQTGHRLARHAETST